MAQEPEQQPQTGAIPDPQFPYGAMASHKSQPLPAPQPSYLSPDFYAQQASPVQQPEMQSGYTVPTPGPYVPPVPQAPYNPAINYAPPQQPYGVGSNYGHSGVTPGYYGNRYGDPQTLLPPPPATPLPLAEALRQLPGQYWRAISRPASAPFANEMGKAGWGIIWVQIVFYTLFVTLLNIFSRLVQLQRPVPATNTSSLSPATVEAIRNITNFIVAISPYIELLYIPLSIFIGTGILYLLAKAFGGVGRFVQQLYCTLLFLIPLGLIVSILSLLLNLLPAGGSLLVIFLALANVSYEGVLMGFMLMPVHRISGARATGSVLLLFGIAFLLACVLSFILAIIFAASIQPQ
jgi:hypothetical protein